MRRIAHALALTATLALALGACASGKATGLPAGPTTPAQSKECGAGIDMTDALKFVPQSCTAKVDETVTWTNAGSVPHTVTAKDEKIFDSGADKVLNGGDKFKFTFKKAGTYPYYCRLHSTDKVTGMVGTITVEA